jgi:hypothetical protein
MPMKGDNLVKEPLCKEGTFNVRTVYRIGTSTAKMTGEQ